MSVTTQQPIKADPYQLAGHVGHILKLPDGKIKKLVKDQEANFYLTLQDRKLPPEALEFIPRFYGVEYHDGKKYIIIEDLTHGLETVSMMDMKMGTSSADPLMPEAKRATMAAKDKVTTTASLGIRVCGVRIWNTQTNQAFKEGKPWGKKLTDAQMPIVLRQFLSNPTLRKDIAHFFLDKLCKLLNWQEVQTSFKVYSSSLFFAYDASAKTAKGSVKMIDFAHVIDITDGKSHDEEYLFGLRNLIKLFEDIVNS